MARKFLNGVTFSNLTSNGFLKTSGSNGTVVVDTNTYQPANDDLTAIAALTGTGYLRRTGTNTWTLDASPSGSSEVQIDQKGGTSSTYGTLTGNINGTNTDFTVSAGAYATGKLTVEINGQLQTQGTNEDWVELVPSSGTFRFNTPPPVGSVVTAIYGRTAAPASAVAWGNISGNVTSQTDIYPAIRDANQSEFLLIRQALGSIVKEETIPLESAANSSLNLVSQRAYYQSLFVSSAMTATGVLMNMSSVGNYTGNNVNAVALYSYLAGTLTKIAETANIADLWKTARQSIPFGASVSLSRGLYFFGILYCSSSESVAPKLRTPNTNTISMDEVFDFTNAAKVSGFRGSQTSLPSTESMSNITSQKELIYMGLY